MRVLVILEDFRKDIAVLEDRVAIGWEAYDEQTRLDAVA